MIVIIKMVIIVKITKNDDGNKIIIMIMIITITIGSTKDQLGNRYKVKDIGLKEVIEEPKQRVVATSSKLRRYEARTEHNIQNRISHIN